MGEQGKHTPGPWPIRDATVEEDGSIHPRHIVGGSRDLVVMYANERRNTDGTLVSDEMAEAVGDVRSKTANLRLIAAAPDLLAALRDCRAGLVYIRESHGELYGVGFDRAIHAADEAIAKAEGRT